MTRTLDSRLCMLTTTIIALFFTTGISSSAPPAEPLDLSTSSMYANYNFGNEERIIDFATQPLAAPLGVIVEVMKRDRILLGQLQTKGMEIRFHSFLKGADANFFIKKGLVDMTMTGDTPAIILAATYDAVIAGITKQGHTSIIAKNLMQVSELKGKRIGYPFGSTAHYGLLVALYAAGMKESDVVMVPTEINKLPSALEEGRLDAISAWEPIPMSLLAKHPDYAVLQQFINTNYFCVTRAFVAQHREATSLLMAAFIRALRWMKLDEQNLRLAATWNKNDQEVFLQGPSDVTVEQLMTITRIHSLPLADAPYIPQKDLTEKGLIAKSTGFLKSQGLLPESIPWQKIKENLDREMMAEVLSAAERYQLNKFDYAQ